MLLFETWSSFHFCADVAFGSQSVSVPVSSAVLEPATGDSVTISGSGTWLQFENSLPFTFFPEYDL
jgi:hypothetical protein